ncbi:hypothetical protein BHU72_13530 [Desulfuribacillus stibiiarsenatis]|uniref:Uncharacterized protein n=1 Tax=Desulfuribacillus stibiiarsenatis TaxID=1390249 RepID=A0A1E5L8S8_9FIRM|nr:hypothetical protein [Desulfuribacillus stibiiarsenatis]OEH86434.1 hypothetical protein BHU72_13530 [Desulfuribacillus stibiiarsenatis]
MNKKKILTATLALSLALPVAAFAAEPASIHEKLKEFGKNRIGAVAKIASGEIVPGEMKGRGFGKVPFDASQLTEEQKAEMKAKMEERRADMEAKRAEIEAKIASGEIVPGEMKGRGFGKVPFDASQLTEEQKAEMKVKMEERRANMEAKRAEIEAKIASGELDPKDLPMGKGKGGKGPYRDQFAPKRNTTESSTEAVQTSVADTM